MLLIFSIHQAASKKVKDAIGVEKTGEDYITLVCKCVMVGFIMLCVRTVTIKSPVHCGILSFHFSFRLRFIRSCDRIINRDCTYLQLRVAGEMRREREDINKVH